MIAETSPNMHAAPALVAAAVDAALPAIIMDARRAASAIVMGEHGKRQAGAGDAFWQHREWHNGESIRQIDWRRSARSDTLFVRERERQLPALLQVWCDQSASMNWASTPALSTKAERALVLGLALSIATRSGGERVCALGGVAPLRDELSFVGILAQAGLSFPQRISTGQVLIFSDGLESPAIWAERAGQISGNRAHFSVVLIADPAERDFPYEGRVNFSAPSDPTPLIVGRAQAARADYQSAYQRHLDAVCGAITQKGGQVLMHMTSDPIMPLLLRLAGSLSGPRSHAGLGTS